MYLSLSLAVVQWQKDVSLWAMPVQQDHQLHELLCDYMHLSVSSCCAMAKGRVPVDDASVTRPPTTLGQHVKNVQLVLSSLSFLPYTDRLLWMVLSVERLTDLNDNICWLIDWFRCCLFIDLLDHLIDMLLALLVNFFLIGVWICVLDYMFNGVLWILLLIERGLIHWVMVVLSVL